MIVFWGFLDQWASSKRLVVYFIGETQVSFIKVLCQCQVVFLECGAFKSLILHKSACLCGYCCISGLVDMSLTLPSSNSSGSDISLGSMGSTPGGMAGNSFPFGNMGPTDMSGMGMVLPTSIGLDTTFASNDGHNQNGIGGMALSSHDADVNSHRESLGSLGQLPRNFSLSDLTAELTNSAG